jgi:hypothetical protein
VMRLPTVSIVLASACLVMALGTPLPGHAGVSCDSRCGGGTCEGDPGCAGVGCFCKNGTCHIYSLKAYPLGSSSHNM